MRYAYVYIVMLIFVQIINFCNSSLISSHQISFYLHDYKNNFFYHLKDLGLDFGIVAEAFETSVPWDKCESLCRNTKAVVREECKKHNINHYLISCRVTQTYDAGACVYFYFGFRWNPECQNPVDLYEEIELMARNEILASGILDHVLNISLNDNK